MTEVCLWSTVLGNVIKPEKTMGPLRKRKTWSGKEEKT